jgi:hypothetical protein
MFTHCRTLLEWLSAVKLARIQRNVAPVCPLDGRVRKYFRTLWEGGSREASSLRLVAAHYLRRNSGSWAFLKSGGPERNGPCPPKTQKGAVVSLPAAPKPMENRLLKRLSKNEYNDLIRSEKAISLAHGDEVYREDSLGGLSHVYFPTSGMISLTVLMENGTSPRSPANSVRRRKATARERPRPTPGSSWPFDGKGVCSGTGQHSARRSTSGAQIGQPRTVI